MKKVSVSSARRVFTEQTEAANGKCRYLSSARAVMRHNGIGYLPSDFENVHTLVENMESILF